ncbi:rpl24p [Nucleospora cyclopteri]
MPSKVSLKRGKQRKRHFNSKGKERMKKISASLSKDLYKEIGIKRTIIQEGDVVLVKVGKFKGKTGKVTAIVLEKLKIHIEGCTINKSTGGTAFVPIDPSNVRITELAMNEFRKAAFEEIKRIKEAYKEQMKNNLKYHGKLHSINNV